MCLQAGRDEGNRARIAQDDFFEGPSLREAGDSNADMNAENNAGNNPDNIAGNAAEKQAGNTATKTPNGDIVVMSSTAAAPARMQSPLRGKRLGAARKASADAAKKVPCCCTVTESA